MSHGETLSKVLGGNAQASQKAEGGNTVHKSPTTNSYGKCIDALAGQFSPEIIGHAKQMIDKHDQNSFTETRVLGEIFEDDCGTRTLKARKVLTVKGTYNWVVFAHLKTIEMWVTNVPA